MNSKCVLMLAMTMWLGLAAPRMLAEETAPPADTAQTPEAKEAAEEDAAEAKLSENEQIEALKSVKGRVMVGNDGTDNPEIVGQIFADSGESYFVKLASKDLLKKFQELNNKNATLMGKFRNKNKYIVVQSIFDAGGAPSERKKRGGI